MNTLIVEDDFTSRLMLQEFLLTYGPVHIATNGAEAVAAFRDALAKREHYDLMCLDIMLPDLSGHKVLCEIRSIENGAGIQRGHRTRIVMTTSLADEKNVTLAAREACDVYMTKPIGRKQLVTRLVKLGLRLDPQTRLWTFRGPGPVRRTFDPIVPDEDSR